MRGRQSSAPGNSFFFDFYPHRVIIRASQAFRRGTMKKTAKILGFIAAGLVLLLLLLGTALAFFVPWDKVKDAAVVEASKQLNREVRIEKLDFNIFKGIGIKGFYIGNRKGEGFSDGAFVAAEQASAGYEFLPLLFGKVNLTTVELDSPKILIEKNKRGEFNFADLAKELKSGEPSASAEAQGSGAGKLPVKLSMSKFAINSGEIDCNDYSSALAVKASVKDLNVSVTGLALEGDSPFKLKASAVMEYNKTPVNVSAEGSMRIRFNEQEIDLQDFTAKLTGFAFTASGEVKKFLESPTFSLQAKVSADSGELKKTLAPMLPPAAAAYLKDTSLSGIASFGLSAKGEARQSGKSYEVYASGSGSADLTPVEAKYSEVFVKPKGLKTGITFDFDIKKDAVRAVSKIETAASAFTADKSISDIFGSPKVNVSLSGNLSVPELVSLLPLMKDMKTEGAATVDMKIYIPITKDYAVDYKGIKINGSGNLKDLGLGYGGIKYGISKLNSGFALTEKSLKLPNVSFLAGTSAFSGYVTAANYNLETMADWKTKFEGDVKAVLLCQRFLADEAWDALPSKTKSAAGPAAAAGQSDSGFSDDEIKSYTGYVYGKLKAEADLNIKELVFKKLRFTELSSNVKLAKRAASLTSSMNGYGGAVKAAAKIDLNTPGLGYSLSGSMSGVQTGEFINAAADSFLEGWMSGLMKDKLSGAAGSDFAFFGRGANKKEVKQNLSGSLNFKLVDGKLKNWQMLSDGLKALGVNPSGEIPFRQMTGKTRIGGQKVSVDELKVVCDDARYNLGSGGWVAFDRDLDSEMQLPMRNDFSPSIASKLGDAGKYAAGQDGWVPVDFDVFGRLAAPSFRPNLDRSLANAGKNAENAAKKKLQEEGEGLKKKGVDLLKGLFGK